MYKTADNVSEQAAGVRRRVIIRSPPSLARGTCSLCKLKLAGLSIVSVRSVDVIRSRNIC